MENVPCTGHNMPCMVKTGVKSGANYGKSFYICGHSSDRCSFVKPCDTIGLVQCDVHPAYPIDLRGLHLSHSTHQKKLFHRCAAVRGTNKQWCGHTVVETNVKPAVKPLGDATQKKVNIVSNHVRTEKNTSDVTAAVIKADVLKANPERKSTGKSDSKDHHTDSVRKSASAGTEKASDFASLAHAVPQAQRLKSEHRSDHNSSFSSYRDSPSVKVKPAVKVGTLLQDTDSDPDDSVEILDDSHDAVSKDSGLSSSFTQYRDPSPAKPHRTEVPPTSKVDSDGDDSCVIVDDDEDEKDGPSPGNDAQSSAVRHAAAESVAKTTSQQPAAASQPPPSAAQPAQVVTKLVIPRDSQLSRNMRLKEDLSRQLQSQKHLMASVKITALPDGGRKIRDKLEELTQQVAALEISIQEGQKTLINDHLKQEGKPSLSSTTTVTEQKPKLPLQTVSEQSQPVNGVSRLPSSSSSQSRTVSGQVLQPGQKQTLITHHTQPLPSHVLQQMYAANPQAMTLYGGRMTTARLREVGSVTTEAIERLHKQLESCPETTSEEEDPRGVKVPLMTHQRQAIKWLKWRENQQPPGGILADDMGLGKTLTMISHVLKSKHVRRAKEKEEAKKSEEEEDSDEFDEDDAKKKKKKKSKDKSGWLSKDVAEGVIKSNATLIICPASLVHQWEKEIDRRVKRGLLKVILYHGPNREPDVNKLAEADIVLTTYSIVCREIPISEEMKKDKIAQDMPAKDKDLGSAEDAKSEPGLLRVGWERIILDEGHSIKNHKSLTAMSVCRLRAGKRWVLTGTPIQNDLLDMYSLLRFLRCSPFDEYKLWKRQVDNKSEKGKQRLNVLVKALLLRRTKDQKGEHGKALVALPDRHTFSHELELAADERKVYDKIFAQSRSMMQSYIARHEEKALEKQLLSGQKSDNPFNKTTPTSSQPPAGAGVSPGFSTATQMMSSRTPTPGGMSQSSQQPHQKPHAGQMLLCLLRLRQCCGHLSLMKAAPDVEAMETDGLELDLVQQMTELALAEQRDTVDPSQAKNPSEQRDTVDPSQAKDPSEIFEVHNFSSKIKFLVKKLKEIKEEFPKEKSVVVSQWTKMLDVTEYHLKEANLSCCTIRGNIPPKQRSEIVDRFNSDSKGPQVMLLSLRAGGVGLNLVGGNHLFLLDMHWNPALESQACDRIYRMGQTREVNIHRFVCKDTVEEKIQALQQSKLKLAKNVLSGAGASANKLTLQDLKMLFGLDQPPASASSIPYSNYSQSGNSAHSHSRDDVHRSGYHGNPSSSSHHSQSSSSSYNTHQPRPATFHGQSSKPAHGSYLGGYKHPASSYK